jgi:hypothetical protein
MFNINRGVINPDYREHPAIASQKRIKIAGLHDSDIEMVLAMVQHRNGQVSMVLDSTEQSFEQYLKLHQLMAEVMKEMDRRLQLYAMTVPGDK